MSLIFEVCEEIEDGGAIPCKQPRLDFIAPHLMVAGSESTDYKEKARQTEGVVFASIFHYFVLLEREA